MTSGQLRPEVIARYGCKAPLPIHTLMVNNEFDGTMKNESWRNDLALDVAAE